VTSLRYFAVDCLVHVLIHYILGKVAKHVLSFV